MRHANKYPELFDQRALVDGMLVPQQVARAGLLTCLGTLLSAGGLVVYGASLRFAVCGSWSAAAMGI